MEIHECGRKINQAIQFIDFFVHDILDYSVLNNKEKNFVAQNSFFDVKEAVEAILDIQID
jgi:hypothetical protein